MSRFNILRNADIRNSTGCRYDTNEGYAVSWEEDNNFKQYEEFSGLTTRIVSSQNYFSVATSGVCYVGPTTAQPAFDAATYDTVKVTYRLDIGFNQASPTTGKIQFQTANDPVYDDDKAVEFAVNPDNAYNEYTVDMSQFRDWQGDITRIRLYPFTDGAPGNKIHLSSLSVQSSSSHACATQYDGGGLCSQFGQYSHPCPWTGSGGSCQAQIVPDGLDIVEGLNDELTVDINGYGDQTVTLRPGTSLLLKDISRDIEDKLSNVGIAGYAGNKVEVSFGAMRVTADDTRETISTVVVADTAAARTLGFFDSTGVSTSTLSPGTDAATRYEPAGTVQLSKGEIAHFYLPDQSTSKSSLVVDPANFATEAGRPDFSSVTMEQFVDFPDKTIIDFNHPVSQTGLYTFFGYTGDATADTDILFFRPSASGALTLHATAPLGAGGAVLGKVFDAAISVRLRKGDLIGIYDGRIYTGGYAEHPNMSYFLYDGQLNVGESIELPELYGRGDEGLHLYARGSDRQTGVILDIDFDQPELIEEIEVFASEEVRQEVVNLTQTLSGGINGGPYITGETGLDKFGAQAPALTDLGALTDGVKVNSPTADALHPSWLDGPIVPADKYEQTEFSIIVDFARAVPVVFEISRVILYFREVDNIKHFRLDYPLTTNAADTERNWGAVTGSFDSVSLDGKLLQPTDHPLYTHPMHVTADTLTHSYEFLQYGSIELAFPPVSARSLKYEVKNYFFNDDVTSFEQSDFPLSPGPNILEMEVFATSTPKASIADNFSFESSGDGVNFVQHGVVRDTGTVSAKYLIGYPVRSLKLHISPQGKLNVKSVSASLSQSTLEVNTNVGESTVAMQISRLDYSSTETAVVTNTSDSAYNYYVNISAQRSAVERCLLWNKMGTPGELTKSQIGPSPSISKREGFRPRETNFSLNVPGYIMDPFWMLNGNTKAYISYDHTSTWEPRGNLLGDLGYDLEAEINSKHPDYLTYTSVYLLIDLGQVVDPSEVEMFTRGGSSAVRAFSGAVYYSAENVELPEELDVINGFNATKGPCRWLRMIAVSHDPASFSQVPTINFVRVSLDPTSSVNFNKLPWLPAEKLTNYTFGTDSGGDGRCGEGWHCAESSPNYYAVDLENHYDPYNILTGPQASDGLTQIEDIDILLPGGVASAYSSVSRANADIAYGFTSTADPKKVYWGNFGAEPPEYTRWLLLKSDTYVIDEVVVHINDNDPDKKPLFGSTRWWTSRLGTVTKDYSITPSAGHSISVNYSANQGPAVEEIELLQTLSIDHVLAKKDQFKVMLYVSDVEQLDLTQGHIAIGRNTTEKNNSRSPLEDTAPDRVNYFQWNLSDMASLITTGWNEVNLPFTDNFREGQPFFTRDDYLSLGPTQTSARSRLRWFHVNFVGVENNKEFSVKVADLEMVRGDFLPAKFGNGYYFANQDYARFPLNNFNTLQGTIEFYLRPDWTKTPSCNTCDDPKDHTIFRLFNSEDFMLGLFMTGEGMRTYVTNGSENFFLSDNNSPEYILNDVNTHIAVTWDLLGERSDKGLAFYVNGKLSSSMDATNIKDFAWKTNPNVTLMVGGAAWDGIITPLASSVDGIIDNLKVYNYAKENFSHSVNNQGLEYIRPSDELVEISVDGVNFYGSSARGTNLPLLVRNVTPGQEFTVHVRNKEQSGTTSTEGQERVSYLDITKARPG